MDLLAEYQGLVESRDLRFYHPVAAFSEQDRRLQGERDALVSVEQGERVREFFRKGAATLERVA